MVAPLAGDGWRRWLPPALAGRSREPAGPERLAFMHLPRTGGTAVQHRLEARMGAQDVVRVRMPPDFLHQLPELRSARVVLGHFFYPVLRLLPSAAVATVVREPVDRSISVWEYLQWQTLHRDHQALVSQGIISLDQFLEDEYLLRHVRDNQVRLLGAEFDVEGIVARLEGGEIDLAEARRLTEEAQTGRPDAATLVRAKERLGRMMLVGVTEELPEFVRRLELAIGLEPGPELRPDNATPAATVAMRDEGYGESIRRRLAELNPFDAELYSFARELWESQRERVA